VKTRAAPPRPESMCRERRRGGTAVQQRVDLAARHEACMCRDLAESAIEYM
jgi:hypothetical protein